MRKTSRSRQISLILGLVILGLLQVISQKSSAQPLAVAHVQCSSGSASIMTSMAVYVGFGLNTNAVLFSQFALTPADVGHTFTLNASNDPDFADARLSLENGMPNFVVFGNIHGPGQSWSTYVTTEANFFSPLPVGSNGIDFQGFQIGSIALTVDGLTIEPFASGSAVYFQGTISVYAVPEPSVLAMLGLGCLVLRGLPVRLKCP